MSIILSVILPTHKSGSFIKKWCDSFFKESIKKVSHNIEIVQVDSYPGDNSSEIISKYCEEFLIKYKLILQHPKGPFRAQELGKLNAIGEWLVIVNSDDVIYGSLIEKIIILLRTKYSISKKNSDILFFPINYESFGIKTGRFQNLSNLYDLDSFGSSHSPGMFIKRDSWDKLGRKYSDDFCADYDLYMRALKNDFKIIYLNEFEPIGVFSIGGHSSALQNQLKIFINKIKILMKYGGAKAVLRNLIFILSKIKNLILLNNRRQISFITNQSNERIENQKLYVCYQKIFNENNFYVSQINSLFTLNLLVILNNLLKTFRSKYIVFLSSPKNSSYIYAFFIRYFLNKEVYLNENWGKQKSLSIIKNNLIKPILILKKTNSSIQSKKEFKSIISLINNNKLSSYKSKDKSILEEKINPIFINFDEL